MPGNYAELLNLSEFCEFCYVAPIDLPLAPRRLSRGPPPLPLFPLEFPARLRVVVFSLERGLEARPWCRFRTREAQAGLADRAVNTVCGLQSGETVQARADQLAALLLFLLAGHPCHGQTHKPAARNYADVNALLIDELGA